MTRRDILAASSRRSLGRSLSSRRGGKGEPAGEVIKYDLSESPLIDALKRSPRIYSHHRNDGYVHVSDVLSKCLRQLALYRQMKMTPPATQLNDGVAITYAQGDAIHDFLKRRFILGHKENIFGDWSCVCGETTVEKVTMRAAERHRCEECHGHVNQYKECRLKNDEYMLSGSPDISLRYSAILVGEFKSMASKLFDELIRPVPDHVLQATFYWKLYKECGFSVYPYVSVLYVKKDWTMKLPYKEFLVDATSNEKRLDAYFEDLREFKSATEKGELPPRVVCPTDRAPQAKQCPVCVACFQRQ
jgi:hypothetical protein